MFQTSTCYTSTAPSFNQQKLMVRAISKKCPEMLAQININLALKYRLHREKKDNEKKTLNVPKLNAF